MAQYDLHLIQNTSVAGTEFSEKMVNIAKGGLLSADASGVPTVLAAGTNGYQLVRSDAAASGLAWQAIAAGHTQGTDTGTTSDVFGLASGGFNAKLKAESASIVALRNAADSAYIDLKANAIAIQTGTINGAPSGGTDIVNKTYADGLLAANDAMIFKGTVGVGGSHEIAAFNTLATYNAGWAYRVITAGTIKGVVCEVGDLIVAMVDRAGTGNVNADWTVLQTNLDGAVIGPASAVDGHVVLFDGTSGKLIKAGTGALGTAAYTASTAYATSAQGTLATNAIPKGTITAADQIVYGTAASTPAVLTVGASTFVGKKAAGALSAMSVSEASTLLGLGTMAAATATDYVAKALFDANTILYATTDNTPAALTVVASSIVGRSSSGAIDALRANDVMNILWQSAPATKASTGTAGWIAKDSNYFYVCVSTNVWVRIALASNW